MIPKIEVKGTRDGILVTLGEGEWEDLFGELLKHLDEQGKFLKGAKLAIDVRNQVLKAAELGRLRNEISGREMSLWAVLSSSPTTETTAQTLGLATRLSKGRPELSASRVNTLLRSEENAIFVQRTLRSGYNLQHTGHIILLGDINPGAEVVATGNIIIWGRARGMVHAGSEGNEEAVICALDLSPMQLRIANRIALAMPQKKRPQPEMAHLVNGQVKVETWDMKKNKGKDL